MRRGRKKFLGTLFTCAGVGVVALVPLLASRWSEKLPLKVRDLIFTGGGSVIPEALSAFHEIQKGDLLFGKKVRNALDQIKSDPKLLHVAVIRDVTGQVSVQAQERKAEALVQMDQPYYADAQGNLFARAKLSDPLAAQLVVITGNWQKRSMNDAPSEEIRIAMELIKAFEKEGIARDQLSELHWNPDNGWTLFPMKGKARAVIGKDRFEEKARRYQQIVSDLKSRGIGAREIDLDFAQQVVVKLVGTEAKNNERG